MFKILQYVIAHAHLNNSAIDIAYNSFNISK